MISPQNAQNPGSSGMQFNQPPINQMNNMNLNDDQSRFNQFQGNYGQPGQNSMGTNQPGPSHDVFESGLSTVGEPFPVPS